MAKLTQKEVLRYCGRRISQETVKRHYLAWRAQQVPPIPERCDIATCQFHTGLPVWNGKNLKLVLDHENGVSGDNSPSNLRLLCPNCNSQQPTHGGGNKGKVEQSSGGFAVVRTDGKKDYTLPADPAEYKIASAEIELTRVTRV